MRPVDARHIAAEVRKASGLIALVGLVGLVGLVAFVFGGLAVWVVLEAIQIHHDGVLETLRLLEAKVCG